MHINNFLCNSQHDEVQGGWVTLCHDIADVISAYPDLKPRIFELGKVGVERIQTGGAR